MNASSCERIDSISRDANLEDILIMPYKRNVANAKFPVNINRTRSRMESFTSFFRFFDFFLRKSLVIKSSRNFFYPQCKKLSRQLKMKMKEKNDISMILVAFGLPLFLLALPK